MPKIAKAYAITDAKISFVSLVDKAANKKQFLITKSEDGAATVSYTHLDVYKRQAIYIRTEKVSHVLVLWLIGAMKKYWHISIITIW